MVLLNLVQKSRVRSSFKGSSGQAAVEYVLLLVVAVSLVFAVAYQIFTPLQAYLKSYMGDYISCLLETGELPSLGNPDSAGVLQDAGCNAKFAPATLAKGRPPNVSSGSSSDSSKDSSEKSSESGNSSEAYGVADSSSSGSGSTGKNLLYSRSKSGGTATDGPSADSGKKVEIALDAKGGGFFKKSGSFGDSLDNAREKRTTLDIYGVNEEQRKKQEQKDGNRRTVATGENFGPPPKKIPVKKPELKAEDDEADEPMTIGNFFRILLIAAIIIALVIVLGSQALKIAKSSEK